MSCLYILKINPLSVASFAVIFSCSEACIFILFIVSFAVQKLLSFTRSRLFIFVFIFINLRGGSEIILPAIYVKECTSLFSSKSFIVSGLTYKALIHFGFISVYGAGRTGQLHVHGRNWNTS